MKLFRFCNLNRSTVLNPKWVAVQAVHVILAEEVILPFSATLQLQLAVSQHSSFESLQDSGKTGWSEGKNGGKFHGVTALSEPLMSQIMLYIKKEYISKFQTQHNCIVIYVFTQMSSHTRHAFGMIRPRRCAHWKDMECRGRHQRNRRSAQTRTRSLL